MWPALQPLFPSHAGWHYRDGRGGVGVDVDVGVGVGSCSLLTRKKSMKMKRGRKTRERKVMSLLTGHGGAALSALISERVVLTWPFRALQ